MKKTTLDPQKNQPGTLPDKYQNQSQYPAYNQGVLRTISAPSPQVLRTFSAYMCGKGVEMVRRWCGKWGKYLPDVY